MCRRVGPLALAGAFIGPYLTVGESRPHEHEVALDLGPSAPTVTDVELSSSDPRALMDEAALTTQCGITHPGQLPHAFVPRYASPTAIGTPRWR